MASAATRHLTDDELLDELDHMSQGPAARAAHLDDCWSCRARLDELQATVHAFVRLREEVLLAGADRPPVWPGLEAGMDRIDAGLAGASWPRRFRRRLADRWITRAAVAATLLLTVWVGVSTGAAARVGAGLRAMLTQTRSHEITLASYGPSARVWSPLATPVIRYSATVTLSAAPSTTPVNLVDLELDAFWRLHQAGALIAEEVAVDHSDQQLSIRARVSDATRKAALQQALAPVEARGARVHVETFAESAAAMAPIAPGTVAIREARAVVDRSAAADLLTSHFGKLLGIDAADRVTAAVREFSALVLDESRQVTLNAFALKRVVDKFPADVIARASDPARVTYQVLVREYAGAVETRTAALRRDLETLFGSPALDSGRAPSNATASEIARLASELEDHVRAAFAVQAGAEDVATIGAQRMMALAVRLESAAAGIRQTGAR